MEQSQDNDNQKQFQNDAKQKKNQKNFKNNKENDTQNLQKNQQQYQKPKIDYSKNKEKILVGNIATGDGLWCIQTVQDTSPSNEKKEIAQKEKIYNDVKPYRMNKIDMEAEQGMIKFLEKQCQDLGLEIEKERGVQAKINLELVEQKGLVFKQNKRIDELIQQLEEANRQKQMFDNQLEELRANYNKLFREHSQTQAQLQSEKNKNLELLKQQDQLFQNNEKEQKAFDMSLEQMQERMVKLEKQNAEFRKLLDLKQEIDFKEGIILENSPQQKVKQKIENGKKKKIQKLAEENAILSNRVLEGDKLKRLLQEKNEKLLSDAKQIAKEKNELEEQIKQFKKRISDLNSLKQQGNKIREGKIQETIQSMEQLKKENDQFRKKFVSMQKQIQSLKGQQPDFEEGDIQLFEVEAKPYLFGPNENNIDQKFKY